MQFHLIFLKFIRYLKGLSEKVFKVRKTHNIRCAKTWYYAFYCGKIYSIFSWNWVFVQPLFLSCWENNVMWWVFVDKSADRTNILRKSLQTMSPSSFRIYVTDFVSPIHHLKTVFWADFISSIYNLKTVFRADLINFQICTLSNLRLVSYLIFIDYQKPILHQIIRLRLIIFDLARCQR